MRINQKCCFLSKKFFKRVHIELSDEGGQVIVFKVFGKGLINQKTSVSNNKMISV